MLARTGRDGAGQKLGQGPGLLGGKLDPPEAGTGIDLGKLPREPGVRVAFCRLGISRQLYVLHKLGHLSKAEGQARPSGTPG